MEIARACVKELKGIRQPSSGEENDRAWDTAEDTITKHIAIAVREQLSIDRRVIVEQASSIKSLESDFSRSVTRGAKAEARLERARGVLKCYSRMIDILSMHSAIDGVPEKDVKEYEKLFKKVKTLTGGEGEKKRVITTEAIKALRKRSGVGLMQCRDALITTDGDMEKAVEYLKF